ncbi:MULTISPECIES: MFS transporter [Rhizobium]|uniref:MFS family arabinose efflux permease n=1 Tax=Rhizobium tropici TaxID=398 RepID=A0A6P1C1Z0_RHITR|nr:MULTISPECIES: MFS transporter [Rhizobium]AGB71569.1 putative major facilitator superfamily (MFS) drug efflux transporter [Rhizobium tropici CIAT 899]MBB4240070.1 putative MFS family arabinose efflux permease [Rhizobium tropici]MBB5591340.1 putative MFS family arabinose efflux permease [Rhizobium tropici]MBB6490576.1 putative MFS family arabinose efflux permease [Rhizobium tropici]NEV10222.1 MFS transporter [Rhizobium tropici]
MPATAAARRESTPLPEKTLSPLLTFMFAAACGLVAANLYYGQPLAGPISQSLGFSPAATGLIVTLTQIGYGLGLLLIVPLGDLLENRKLVLTLVALAAVALVGAAFAWSPSLFLLASLCIGLASVAVQVLVPFAAHMAPDASRGAVVGNVMSGLLVGIMLARPAASFLSELLSWHAVYIISAGVMIGLIVILRLVLPTRVPHTKLHYGQLLSSMGHLALRTPVLQRRALYQACMFGAFSLFWTTTPLLLASPAFGLTQNGIALFALAGAAGAVASPIAGRVADRGWTKLATAFALVLAIVAFLIGHFSGSGSLLALITLTLSGIMLDFGVQTNLVLGQRAIFALSAEHRSRLNGLYMATFFAGGALGSALGGWAYATGGWNMASWIGVAFPVIALLAYLTEREK